MTSTTVEFLTREDANAATSALQAGDLIVVDKQSKIIEEPPPPPYETAALLEDATARLGWEAVKVMDIAQTLFEGIDLYGIHTGLITYHRTSSTRLAPEAIQAARQVIVRLYGDDALPAHLIPRTSMGKVYPTQRWIHRLALRLGLTRMSKALFAVKENQQTESAHEAIRPTSADRLPDSLTGHLDGEALALYRLIWERFIASQMKPARYRLVTVELDAQA